MHHTTTASRAAERQKNQKADWNYSQLRRLAIGRLGKAARVWHTDGKDVFVTSDGTHPSKTTVADRLIVGATFTEAADRLIAATNPKPEKPEP